MVETNSNDQPLYMDPKIRDIIANRIIKKSEKLIEGCRNNGLTSLAGKLRNLGMDEAELEVWLSKANNILCHPPLPEKEIKTIAKSIGKRPINPSFRKRK